VIGRRSATSNAVASWSALAARVIEGDPDPPTVATGKVSITLLKVGRIAPFLRHHFVAGSDEAFFQFMSALVEATAVRAVTVDRVSSERRTLREFYEVLVMRRADSPSVFLV
jgi:hypothetical protein